MIKINQKIECENVLKIMRAYFYKYKRMHVAMMM
jgi:hypothetical protein